MKSKLRCIGCETEFDAEEYRVKCDCGEILEVVHDLTSFNRTAQDWKNTFDERKQQPAFQRYRDIILPDLPDEHIVTLKEGDTPLYRLNEKTRSACDIGEAYLKHEGMNPTLSFKDRGMVATISWAYHIGARFVICASTGDTSASASAYSAAAEGMHAVVLLPQGQISYEQLSQPIMFGALTIQLDSDFDGCMRVIKDLVDEQYPIYLANSMNSFRVEGQKAIALEILHEFNWDPPEWILVPTGNAGNVTAIGKGIKECYELGIIKRLPRLAAVQVKGADPMYQSYVNNFETYEPVQAQETVASAMKIGDPVSFKKATRILQYFDGAVESVTDAEAMDAKALVDASGVPICPHSGVGVAGLKKMRARGTIGKDERAVVVMPAHASKFSQAAVDYHSDEKNTYANSIRQLPADTSAVKKLLHQVSGNQG